MSRGFKAEDDNDVNTTTAIWLMRTQSALAAACWGQWPPAWATLACAFLEFFEFIITSSIRVFRRPEAAWEARPPKG